MTRGKRRGGRRRGRSRLTRPASSAAAPVGTLLQGTQSVSVHPLRGEGRRTGRTATAAAAKASSSRRRLPEEPARPAARRLPVPSALALPSSSSSSSPAVGAARTPRRPPSSRARPARVRESACAAVTAERARRVLLLLGDERATTTARRLRLRVRQARVRVRDRGPVRRPARAAVRLLRLAERARRAILLLLLLRVRAACDERLAGRAADARRVRGRAASADALERRRERCRRRLAGLQQCALLGLVVLRLELRVGARVGAVRLLELVRAATLEREALLGRLDAVLEQADLGMGIARDRVALRLEDCDALRARGSSGGLAERGGGRPRTHLLRVLGDERLERALLLDL